MVRFACPQCNSVHEFPDQQVGKKVDCPTCGQRLQIPSPKMQMPRNKTVLGSLLAPFVRVKPVPKVATCPVCSQKLKIPEKHIDKATCPTCRTEFLIKPNAPKKTDRLEESPTVRSASAPRQSPAEVPAGPESLKQPVAKGEQWYYTRASKQFGPVSAADLKHLASSGQLSATDLVWKEGMPNWVSAEKIFGLFAAPVASMLSAPSGSSRVSATQIVAGPPPGRVALANPMVRPHWLRRYLPSSSLGLILLCSFLPWMEVSCIIDYGGKITVTQSGFQSIYGGFSIPPLLEKKIMNSREFEGKNAKAKANWDVFCYTAPFAIVFLLAIAIAIAIAVTFMVYPGTFRLRLTGGLLATAFIVLFIQTVVGFPLERQLLKTDFGRDHTEMAAMLGTSHTGWLWFVFTLVVLSAAVEAVVSTPILEKIIRAMKEHSP